MVYGNLIRESVDNIDDIIHEFDLFDSIINESNIEIMNIIQENNKFNIKEKINKFIDMILKWFDNIKLVIIRIIRKIKLKAYKLFKNKNKISISKVEFEAKITKSLIINKYTRFKLSNYFNPKPNLDSMVNDIKNILDKISNGEEPEDFNIDNYNDLYCINTQRMSEKDFEDIINKNKVDDLFVNVENNLTEFIENDLEKLLKQDSTGKLIYDAYKDCMDNEKKLTDYMKKFQDIIDYESHAFKMFSLKLRDKLLDRDAVGINNTINEKLKIIKKCCRSMISVIKTNLDCCKIFFTYYEENTTICLNFYYNIN